MGDTWTPDLYGFQGEWWTPAGFRDEIERLQAEIGRLTVALVEISRVRPVGATPNPLLNQVYRIAAKALRPDDG